MAVCNCCGGSERDERFEVNGYRLGRCTTCNLHYIDPMPERETRLADVHAGRYGGERQVLDARRQLASEQTQEARFRSYLDLAERHASHRDGRFLDVGCGAGTLMTMAAARGWTPEGIELTADRLTLARSGGATVHDRPIESIGFPDDTFAVVSLSNVFSHLADPAGTITEIARVLEPGGVLVMATGEIDGPVEKHHLPEWTLGDEMFYLGTGTAGRYAGAAGLELIDTLKTWLPDAIYTRERLKVRGRSRARNAVKSAMLVPGVLPVLRWAMRRRQADNPIWSAIFVLRKP